jgi:predicted nucleotidyltransferase component of viral defense system
VIFRGLIIAAYEDAVKRFSTDLTHDHHKIEFVNGKVGLRDVQESVAQSLAKYEASQTHTAARKWLHKVALRIQFYGNVLDVIAQQHPEYVSLAWGAIKFLLQVWTSQLGNAKHRRSWG